MGRRLIAAEDVNPWEREDARLGPRRLLGLLRASLRLAWRASRSETTNLLVLQTLAGLALPVQVLAGTWALDSIFAASRSNGGMADALPSLGLALAAMTAGQIVATTARHRQRLLPELAGQAAQEMLAEKAAAIELEALETPAFHDRLNRAQNEASFRPANMVADIARIVSSSVAVVGLAVLLLAVHPLLVAGLLAAMLPLSWASMVGGRAYYRYAVRRTPRRRLIAYLQGLLSQLDSGKEIRAFALAPYLLEHRRRLFDEEMADLRKLVRERLRRDVRATLASSLVVAGGVVFILWLHFSQRISLAETVASTLTTLRADDLTFCYRDGDAPVLRGVSMEIKLGETVAVVGENGETRLGRRFVKGHQLSIGQWQRVALARVFFRDAPLVIMDEPTASLDARSEHELFKSMRKLFCDRAVLLISHRFSSVRMADRIYVLRDGAVAEVGTHDELMASDGLYAELFGLQAASYAERPD